MNIKKIVRKTYINLVKNYSSVINNNAPWVITSYIPEPFYFQRNKKYMKSHQNKKEALAINKIFNNFGFNHLIIRYDKNRLNIHNSKDVKIIFGLEPNFVKLAQKYPNAIKIYYATGAYFEHQNSVVIQRTDQVNAKYNSKISYSRLVRPHKSVELADFVIQVGSKFTIETYPEHFRKKIIRIRQTSHEFEKIDLDEKKKSYSKDDYIWFGSKGTILKGLDILLEYFSEHKDINLHIVGPIEKDFEGVYYELLYNRPNIKYYGYLEIDSKDLLKIAQRSTFVILPSASEGGVPGSVLNMMKLGLIPIVSKYAAFDEIDEFGILINEINYEGVHQAIIQSKNLNSIDIENRFNKCSEFIKNNYNLKVFERDLSYAIRYSLENNRKA